MAMLKNDGKTTLAARAIANTPAAFTFMAVSENTDAEVATGTTLTGEIADTGLARVAATCTNPSVYVTQWVGAWASITGSKALRKLAIFNAASNGNMLMEHLFPSAKDVDPEDTFTATVQMTTSAA